jgi:hypothetical protein
VERALKETAMAYFKQFCVTDRENPRTIQNTQSPGQDLNPVLGKSANNPTARYDEKINKNEEINK